MKRRNAVLSIGAAAVAPLAAFAQTARPMKRIRFFNLAPAHVDAPYLIAFHAGMVEQDLLEGRDYVVEVRSANGNMQSGPAVAVELVATRPDLILGMGDPSVRMLLQATQTIPIVFGVAMDPVGTGLVASLRQPGGNATGLTTMATELWPKRMQLLKEAFPISLVLPGLAPMTLAGLPHSTELSVMSSKDWTIRISLTTNMTV